MPTIRQYKTPDGELVAGITISLCRPGKIQALNWETFAEKPRRIQNAENRIFPAVELTLTGEAVEVCEDCEEIHDWLKESGLCTECELDAEEMASFTWTSKDY